MGAQWELNEKAYVQVFPYRIDLLSSVVIGKPIRTEISSGIFSFGSVQNVSEPFSSKDPQKLEKDIKKCSLT